eukprot:1196131-Prorocentrum_minimum.AAC.2
MYPLPTRPLPTLSPPPSGASATSFTWRDSIRENKADLRFSPGCRRGQLCAPGRAALGKGGFTRPGRWR